MSRVLGDLTLVTLSIIFITLKIAAGASRDEIIDPEQEFFEDIKTTPEPPVQLYKDWADWESWKAPEIIKKLAPVRKLGYDYEGLPVFLLEYGKWNYRELTHLPEVGQKEFEKYFEQYLRTIEKAGRDNGGDGAVLIMDFEGFALRNFASQKAVQLALKSVTSAERLHPFVRYAFCINTNFMAQTIMNAARPFVANLFDKAEIHGTRSEKWMPALLRKIPANQLPRRFGGTKDDPPVSAVPSI